MLHVRETVLWSGGLSYIFYECEGCARVFLLFIKTYFVSAASNSIDATTGFKYILYSCILCAAFFISKAEDIRFCIVLVKCKQMQSSLPFKRYTN